MSFSVSTFRIMPVIALMAWSGAVVGRAHAQGLQSGGPLGLSKNWVFMNLDDLAATPSMEEMLHIPEYGEDGLATKKPSPIERYYTGLEREQKPPPPVQFQIDGPNPARKRAGWGDEADPQFGSIPAPPSADGTRQPGLFQSESGARGQASTYNGLSELFGSKQNTPVPERSIAQKARMEEFKQLLGLSPSAPAAGADPFNREASGGLQGRTPGAGSLNPVAGFIDPRSWQPSSPATGSYGIPSSGNYAAFDAQPGTINPLAIPGVNSGANPNAIGLTGLSPALPKAETPSITPPRPTFAAPQRKF